MYVRVCDMCACTTPAFIAPSPNPKTVQKPDNPMSGSPKSKKRQTDFRLQVLVCLPPPNNPFHAPSLPPCRHTKSTHAGGKQRSKRRVLLM